MVGLPSDMSLVSGPLAEQASVDVLEGLKKRLTLLLQEVALHKTAVETQTGRLRQLEQEAQRARECLVRQQNELASWLQKSVVGLAIVRVRQGAIEKTRIELQQLEQLRHVADATAKQLHQKTIMFVAAQKQLEKAIAAEERRGIVLPFPQRLT